MPENYDFRQPMTLTREHARALEVSFQTFARQWGTLLSSRLGALTTVSLEGVSLKTYDDYIQTLPTSTTAVVLMADPSRSPLLLQIPTNATMTIIDCLLGGPASDLHMPFRELTEIELKLMGDMLDLACSELSYAMNSIGPVTYEVRSVKYNPGFIQLVNAGEAVVVGEFEMRVGPVTAPITLMMIAEPILAVMRSGDEVAGRTVQEQQEHDAASRQLAARLTEVPMPVSVRFAGRTMSAVQISELQVGTVIALGHPADRPLDIVVGDVTLGHAAIGANGTRIACLVVSTEEEA